MRWDKIWKQTYEQALHVVAGALVAGLVSWGLGLWWGVAAGMAVVLGREFLQNFVQWEGAPVPLPRIEADADNRYWDMALDVVCGALEVALGCWIGAGVLG
jgi:hypothetical protein